MQARRCGALRRQGTGSSCLLKAGHGNERVWKAIKPASRQAAPGKLAQRLPYRRRKIFPPESRSIFFTYATDYKVLVMQLALGTEKLDLGESAEQILEAPGDGS
jgi:hypothetical protein